MRAGLDNVEQRAHVMLPKVVHRADIYMRLDTGHPALFHYQAFIVKAGSRFHWEQSPGHLVPLDKHGDDLFLQGHGRPR